jgi:CIC family chloride channel protein
VVSRLWSGDLPEFALPGTRWLYVELPPSRWAICGLVAVMKAIFLGGAGDRITNRLNLWLHYCARPALADAAGLIACRFPHIIGVGYETTTRVSTVRY